MVDGYVYLLKCAELSNTNIIQLKYSNNEDFENYANIGSDFLIVAYVDNARIKRDELENIFRSKFNLHSGTTYFDDDIYNIKKAFVDFIGKENIDTNNLIENIKEKYTYKISRIRERFTPYIINGSISAGAGALFVGSSGIVLTYLSRR